MRSLIIPKTLDCPWTYRQFGKYKTYNAEDKTQRMHSTNGSAFNTDIYSVFAENIINDGFSGDRSIVRRSITPKVH
jgi:hypothetical protein